MAIIWVAQTYGVLEEETETIYYIRHDADAELSFRVVTEPIVIGYRTSTERLDFLDGCLTVFTITHETTPGVRVSLVWT